MSFSCLFFRRTLLILGSLLLSLYCPSHAQADENDPYDVIYRMGPDSPLAGLTLDTRERRNYKIIPLDEAEKYVDIVKFPPDKFTYVANYWHLDRFYIAAIPSDLQIKETIMQVVYFAPQDIMRHMQGRFDHPNTPVMLFQQSVSRDVNFQPIKIESTTISLEAIGTYDRPAEFGVKPGLDGSLAASFRLLSTETKTRMLVYDLMQETRQYPIVFTGKRAEDFWKFAFTTFHRPEMLDVYHFINNNCTVVWFALLDDFTRTNPKSFYNRTLRKIPFEFRNLFLKTSKISLALPSFIEMHLKRRGVISYVNTYPSLDKEFHGPTPEAWNTCTMMLRSAASDAVKKAVAKIKAITGKSVPSVGEVNP